MMNAYWNIVLPYQISFEDTPENYSLFMQYYGKQDYVFDKIHKYQTEGAMQKDGTKIIYQHNDKIFLLKKRLITEEFKPFYHLFINEFLEFCNHYAERSFYAKIFDKQTFTDFLVGFEKIPLTDFNEYYTTCIKKLPKNDFIYFDTIYSMIVHEGFSLPNDFTLKVVSILSSYDGMNLDVKETLTFHNFTNHVKKMLGKRFRIAKYLFNAAY